MSHMLTFDVENPDWTNSRENALFSGKEKVTTGSAEEKAKDQMRTSTWIKWIWRELNLENKHCYGIDGIEKSVKYDEIPGYSSILRFSRK